MNYNFERHRFLFTFVWFLIINASKNYYNQLSKNRWIHKIWCVKVFCACEIALNLHCDSQGKNNLASKNLLITKFIDFWCLYRRCALFFPLRRQYIQSTPLWTMVVPSGIGNSPQLKYWLNLLNIGIEKNFSFIIVD